MSEGLSMRSYGFLSFILHKMDDLVFMLLAFKAAKLFALRISLLGVSIQSRLTKIIESNLEMIPRLPNAAVRLADFLNLGIRQTKSRSAALLEFGERTFVWRAGTSVAPKSLRRKLGIYLPFSFLKISR
jgi:hypothetical protein